MSDEIRLEHVQSGPPLNEIRALFLEYAQGLNFDLCFQNFDKELAQLPGLYAVPRGRLVLCRVKEKPAGCVALKPLAPEICELKRLFVRPEFRGKQLGLRLTRHMIDEARVIGYTAMRLDTIRGMMDNAIALYKSVGFKEIPAYYNNPLPNVFYMELRL